MKKITTFLALMAGLVGCAGDDVPVGSLGEEQAVATHVAGSPSCPVGTQRKYSCQATCWITILPSVDSYDIGICLTSLSGLDTVQVPEGAPHPVAQFTVWGEAFVLRSQAVDSAKARCPSSFNASYCGRSTIEGVYGGLPSTVIVGCVQN